MSIRSSEPVSYTHLDVYKRQRHCSSRGTEKLSSVVNDDCSRLFRWYSLQQILAIPGTVNLVSLEWIASETVNITVNKNRNPCLKLKISNHCESSVILLAIGNMELENDTKMCVSRVAWKGLSEERQRYKVRECNRMCNRIRINGIIYRVMKISEEDI